MRSQDREIKDLQKKLKLSEDSVREACGREAALKKRNEELRSSKEELLKARNIDTLKKEGQSWKRISIFLG